MGVGAGGVVAGRVEVGTIGGLVVAGGEADVTRAVSVGAGDVSRVVTAGAIVWLDLTPSVTSRR